ncbi:uncharacterized protein SOCE26_097660 [Sorangium cellulosum]|uniref:VWA7 N-terminal domain-containing protein n=1 Tax=Sorangium cellulosum TaxID=56 RepID=A0A2L0F9H1_SORCE|nr:HET-C-related protein [Sorangium cellulosum]AUX48235.1 uncharacterized protein SOCE26_097660 [Sorangium cellulosum]
MSFPDASGKDPRRPRSSLCLAALAAAGLVACSTPGPLAPVPAYPGLRLGPRATGLAVEESDGITFDQAPFSASEHQWMTAEIECSDWLNEAHYHQDTRAQGSSSAHFDNCDFGGALRLIAAEVQAAKASAARGQREEAVKALGRAMHAIQDFYAHSNYVELMEQEHPGDRSAVRPLRLWTEEGRKKVAELAAGRLDGRPLASGERLVSGVAWWGSPKWCPDGARSHGALAKDSLDMENGKVRSPRAWGGTRFHAARALAQAESIAFLWETVVRWPELRGSCGRAVAIITLLDGRREKRP